jgi:riboflavin kinase/FMN adenylyltransferase
MKIINEQDALPFGTRTVVTIGNFDGVHRGHARLIARTVQLAREWGAASAVVTFRPHTRSVVYPELSTVLLTTLYEKAALMANLGVDYVYLVDFDDKFREMEQAEFVEKILAGKLKAARWVMGEGHHVGRSEAGGKKNLHFVCGKYHINMFIEPLEVSGEAAISSTRIRGLVSDGRISKAAAMLGHPYLIAAERVRGINVAEKLGSPTMNFKSPEAGKVIPPPGVYAAEVEVRGAGGNGIKNTGAAKGIGEIDGSGVDNNVSTGEITVNANKKYLTGALYFGDCPTYAGRDTHFEFHALRFDKRSIVEPAVGEITHLWLHKFIRPNIAFKNENALSAQIKTDVNEIKKYFSQEMLAWH